MDAINLLIMLAVLALAIGIGITTPVRHLLLERLGAPGALAVLAMSIGLTFVVLLKILWKSLFPTNAKKQIDRDKPAQ